MEQHPIPQQISTYQFRLIGDMTLRQFSQLAGGVIVAIFFYSLPIVPFIKWLLVLFFVILGFALAFLPLEDRPLDKWITAFFRSIYSPTQFLWQKTKKMPDFLKERPKKVIKEAAAPAPQVSRASLSEYFETFAPPLESKIEEQEKLALEKIEALFQTAKLPPTITPQPRRKEIEEKPIAAIKVKPRKLKIPPSEPVVSKVGFLSPQVQKPKKVPKTKPKPKLTPLPQVKIAPIKKRPKKTRVEPKTSPDLPIPTAPTQGNIIVGMVLNSTGKIVENAIIEIRNKEGLPVRALRSNRLGQFQIVTPLPDGHYELEVEKEGLEFDIIKLSLTGEIVPPIEIRAN